MPGLDAIGLGLGGLVTNRETSELMNDMAERHRAKVEALTTQSQELRHDKLRLEDALEAKRTELRKTRSELSKALRERDDLRERLSAFEAATESDRTQTGVAR